MSEFRIRVNAVSPAVVERPLYRGTCFLAAERDRSPVAARPNYFSHCLPAPSRCASRAAATLNRHLGRLHQRGWLNVLNLWPPFLVRFAFAELHRESAFSRRAPAIEPRS